jgi:hypothetical protein
MFAWVTLQSVQIAWNLWKLAADKTANIFQTDAQIWKSFKAIVCIVVTLIVAFVIPMMSDPDGIRAWIGGHLSGGILFAYNLTAIDIYHRK